MSFKGVRDEVICKPAESLMMASKRYQHIYDKKVAGLPPFFYSIIKIERM
jgi:hypothetical protein